jgi:hypothetical protein
VILDVFYRQRARETPRADNYLAEFPDLDQPWLSDALGSTRSFLPDATADPLATPNQLFSGDTPLPQQPAVTEAPPALQSPEGPRRRRLWHCLPGLRRAATATGGDQGATSSTGGPSRGRPRLSGGSPRRRHPRSREHRAGFDPHAGGAPGTFCRVAFPGAALA